jgi:hypothetical protein
MPHPVRYQSRCRIASTISLIAICSCSAKWETTLDKEVQPLSQSRDAGEPSTGICPASTSQDAFDGSTENADAAPSVLTSVWLSELVIDPPGTDGNNEFVEISGQPCTHLAGLYLASIEGDSESNPGSVDRIFNFQTLCGTDPCRLGPDGNLVLTATNGWQKPADSAATWVTSNALVGGGLENGTNTLILLECTTPPLAGGDWDVGDLGALQIPATCRAVDSLTFLDRASGDFAYAATKIGPKPSAQGAVRCVSSGGSPWWYFGALGNDLQGIVFTGTLSTGSKVAATLTPGMPNDCATDTPVTDAATPEVDSGAPGPINAKATDTNPADASAQTSSTDGGPVSTNVIDATQSPVLTGSSKWWEPEQVGTWPDSGALLDAATLTGPGDTTGTRSAPEIPQASCSLAANRRPKKSNSFASTVIGAIFWFMRRRRRITG